MATKKPKSEEMTGNLDPKHWVQKSDPLVTMRSVPFTLGELKILDTYISRINAADDTRRTVIFTKEEYEELMGLTCANPRALHKHIKALLSRVPELYLPDDGYIPFVLFEKAYYHKDEYGKPIIELTCTETSKELFFCIGKYHYFSYALENIIKLTRKASYLLYIYIRLNRYRGEWDIDLDELRDSVLDCKEQESYQEYKIFKRDVLEPAVKEVNQKTDCHFVYEPVKRGRRVVKIKFIYQSQDQIEGQTSFFDELPDDQSKDEKWEKIYGSEKLAGLAASCAYEFDKAEMEEIQLVLTRIGISNEQHYLREKYAALNVETAKKERKGEKPIKNRFKYFLRMIEDDASAHKASKKEANGSLDASKYLALVNRFKED